MFRKKSAKIKSAYKQDYFHGTGDVDFDFAGPTVQASAVVGWVFLRKALCKKLAFGSIVV